MKIKQNTLGLLVILIVFVGIGFAKTIGVFKTESNKVPIKFQSGEFIGKSNPQDIRGSYTFSNISDNFNVEIKVLSKAFGVENYDNISEIKVKDFENIYANLKEQGIEIGTSSFKLFVSLYCELPYDFTQDIYMPKAAVDILKEKGSLSEEKLKYIEEHSVELNNNK